jgi:NADH dehydrogenase
MTQLERKIVIIGGGFGGLRAARLLAARKMASITLIADKPNAEYYAALYRIACGGTEQEALLPLSAALAGSNVEVVVDAAAAVDIRAHTVQCRSGRTIPYDDLVIAVGSDVAYFGIPGMQESAFTLKSVADARKIHAHLHELLAEASTPETRGFARMGALPEDETIPIVIVGAGPTGVELAG